MKVVFAGTGGFGVPALRALVETGRLPSLVISQPDRPAGRKRVLTPSPLAREARELDLPLFQPERINTRAARERIQEEAPDVLVVISYGQILRPKVLALPRIGCVNVHGSVLPRHRGASPVQAAILSGDPTTGVTTMFMDEGLDSGPILLITKTPIGESETGGKLHDRLAGLGAPLLLSTLDQLETGELKPTPQDDDQVTHCGLISKRDGLVDFNNDCTHIARQVRAYNPWPGARTEVLSRGRTIPVTIERAEAVDTNMDAEPGTVIRADDEGLVVICGKGQLLVTEIKAAGKRAMSIGDFLRGTPIEVGSQLSSHDDS